MKVGFDAKRLFRNYTGLGNYSRTLVGNLTRRFADSDYYLFTQKVVKNDETAEFLAPCYTIVEPKKCRKTWRSWGIMRDIRALGLDVYHGLSHDLPFGIQHSTTKSVVTIHDVCYKTFPDMFPLVERLIYGIKYRHSILHSDRIIAISEATKNDILKYFAVEPSKIEVIYQALNPVFYDRIDRQAARNMVANYGVHGNFILFVGSLNSRKNLLNVLRAYALVDSAKRLPLVVIGNGRGKYAEQCWAQVEQLGLGQDVIHIENLSSMSVLADFYTLATFMIYPSFYEGFGLPVAEAQLCGCPVITSNVSSLPEAGGPNAVYVDPHDVEQIASSMESLFALGDAQREELGQAAARWVRNELDPDRLTAQVESLYCSLIK